MLSLASVCARREAAPSSASDVDVTHRMSGVSNLRRAAGGAPTEKSSRAKCGWRRASWWHARSAVWLECARSSTPRRRIHSSQSSFVQRWLLSHAFFRLSCETARKPMHVHAVRSIRAGRLGQHCSQPGWLADAAGERRAGHGDDSPGKLWGGHVHIAPFALKKRQRHAEMQATENGVSNVLARNAPRGSVDGGGSGGV